MVNELDIVQAYKEERAIFTLLIKKGWIDPVKIRDMEIFLEFKEMEAATPQIMKRYYKIAIRRNLSEETIRKAVAMFK